MEFNKTWIESEITEDAISRISEFSKSLATADKNDRGRSAENDVKTSKIRRFYGEVKRIQAKGIASEKNAFRMLKPKLAYAVGREKSNSKLKHLYEFLSRAMNSVDVDNQNDQTIKKRFTNFVQLFEAIVAYHKYHGGRD